MIPVEDDYSIGRELGKGAYGSVYECTHRLTDRKFAVKVSYLWMLVRNRGLSQLCISIV